MCNCVQGRNCSFSWGKNEADRPMLCRLPKNSVAIFEEWNELYLVAPPVTMLLEKSKVLLLVEMRKKRWTGSPAKYSRRRRSRTAQPFLCYWRGGKQICWDSRRYQRRVWRCRGMDGSWCKRQRWRFWWWRWCYQHDFKRGQNLVVTNQQRRYRLPRRNILTERPGFKRGLHPQTRMEAFLVIFEDIMESAIQYTNLAGRRFGRAKGFQWLPTPKNLLAFVFTNDLE